MQRDRGMSVASAFDGDDNDTTRLAPPRAERRARAPSDLDLLAMLSVAEARKTRGSGGGSRLPGRPPRASGPSTAASGAHDAQARLVRYSSDAGGRSRANSMDLEGGRFIAPGVSSSNAPNSGVPDEEAALLGLAPPAPGTHFALGDLDAVGRGGLMHRTMGQPVALAAQGAMQPLVSPHPGAGQYGFPSAPPLHEGGIVPPLARSASAPAAVDAVSSRFLAPSAPRRARADSAGEGELGSALLELSAGPGDGVLPSPDSLASPPDGRAGGGGRRRRVGSAVSLASGAPSSTLGTPTGPPSAAALAEGLVKANSPPRRRERASSTGSLRELVLLLPGRGGGPDSSGSSGPPTMNSLAHGPGTLNSLLHGPGTHDSLAGGDDLKGLLDSMTAHIAGIVGAEATLEDSEEEEEEDDEDMILVDDDDDIADLALLTGAGGLRTDSAEDDEAAVVAMFTLDGRGSTTMPDLTLHPDGAHAPPLIAPELISPSAAARPPTAHAHTRPRRSRAFSVASVDSALGQHTPLPGAASALPSAISNGSTTAEQSNLWAAAVSGGGEGGVGRSTYGAEIMTPLTVPLTASAGVPVRPAPSTRTPVSAVAAPRPRPTPTKATPRPTPTIASTRRHMGYAPPTHFTIDIGFRVGLRRVARGYAPTFATLPAIAVGILTSVEEPPLKDPRSLYEIPPDRAVRLSVQQLSRQLHTANYGGSSARSRAIVWRGAYTLVQRVARVANWYYARRRRVWDRVKQIKYDHRQKLANNRLRVKGRFVKAADVLGDPKLLAAAVTQDVDMVAMVREAVGQMGGKAAVAHAVLVMGSALAPDSPIADLVRRGVGTLQAALASGAGDDVPSGASSPASRGRKRARGCSEDSSGTGGSLSVVEDIDATPSAPKRARAAAALRLTLSQPTSAAGGGGEGAGGRAPRRGVRGKSGDATPRTAGFQEAMRRAVAKAVKDATSSVRAALGNAGVTLPKPPTE